VWAVGSGDLTGRIGDLSTGGLLLVFALGMAAGVSTCMAMVGGIVLAISASAAGRAAAKGTVAEAAWGGQTSPSRVVASSGSACSEQRWVPLGAAPRYLRLSSWS
jgi:hypothetical protein